MLLMLLAWISVYSTSMQLSNKTCIFAYPERNSLSTVQGEKKIQKDVGCVGWKTADLLYRIPTSFQQAFIMLKLKT